MGNFAKNLNSGKLVLLPLKENLKADFSKSHFQKKKPLKVGVWIWFWYRIKAENVLLTMIPRTDLTQNVACSLICFVGVNQTPGRLRPYGAQLVQSLPELVQSFLEKKKINK